MHRAQTRLIRGPSPSKLTGVSWRWTAAVLALCVIWATPSRAQGDREGEALSLEEAIALALEQAREMIHVREDIKRTEAQYDRAVAAYLPTVDIVLTAQERFRNRPIVELRGPVFCNSSLSTYDDCESTNDFVEGPFVDRQQLNDASEPRFDLIFVARQLVYDGGRTWADIERSAVRKKRLAALYEAISNNVRLDVARRFYGYESARRAEETFRLRVELGRAQLERARTLLEEGRGKAADVANAERNLAEDRVTLARRHFAASRQKRAFNLALAREADTPVALVIPDQIATASTALADLRVPALAEAKEAALQHRPDLRASALLVREYEETILLHAGRYAPLVTFDARYQRGSRRPERVFGSWQDNFYAFLGFTVRWNLFEGGRTEALIQESTADAVKVQATLEDLERRVLSEVSDRIENLALQIQVYDLARNAQRSAKDAVDLARDLFAKGRNTALELRDAELKYTNAQLAVIDARLQVEVAREELRRACGVDLLAL